MTPVMITLGAAACIAAVLGINRLLQKLAFKHASESELSAAEKNSAEKKAELEALEFDLAVAEELGIDPATLNVMSDKVDVAKDKLADAEITLAAEKIEQEVASEQQPVTAKPPLILKAPHFSPAYLADLSQNNRHSADKK
jgi:hypothetical protein